MDEYEAALARIDKLMDNDPEPESSEGQELEALCVLVTQYEEQEYGRE